MPFERVVLLAGKWDTTAIVYNFLKNTTNVKAAVIEEPVSKKEFLKKRIKKLGLLTVMGQVLFQILIAKLLSKTSKVRMTEIIKDYNLETAEIPSEVVHSVPSVNSKTCLKQLHELQPDLIIVHGTRIISKRILQEVGCPFINIHAGITPRYRGSHGAYWALVNNDADHCGVTVHFVDAGIDTGNILFQGKIHLTHKDNFVTYPYLQLAEGLKLLQKAIHLMEQGKLVSFETNTESALWHHPTLWSYLYNRFAKGIK